MNVVREQISLAAHDGTCRAWIAYPEGSGPWPGVIAFMDALAIRPAMVDIAAEIAEAGFFVLLPDMFYRHGDYGTLDAAEVLKQDFRAVLGPLMASTDNFKAGADTAAFLRFLAGDPRVKLGPVGTTGYCMGGGMALGAAGLFPDLIGAAASFHGGGLATDSSKSPHLLAPRIKAELYIGAAVEDRSYPPAMAERLEQALDAAGVSYRAETYDGARHGWTMTDLPEYDEAAASRAMREMRELFARALR